GLFCMMSSAVYLLNDLLDRDRDRQNPRTAKRPLASGDLSVGAAYAALVGLLAVALVGSSFLGTRCLGVIGLYGLINVWYSLRLKQAVIADVLSIGLGF